MSTDINDIPDEIRGVVAQFDSTLGDIEQHLKPILSGDMRNTVKDLDPIDRAKLQLAMAYSVNSLFFMYLRTQGIDARNHPVRGGLERVQQYMKKIKAAQRDAEKQRPKIDKDAARRFVLNSLSSDGFNKKSQPIQDGLLSDNGGDDTNMQEADDTNNASHEQVQDDSHHDEQELRALKKKKIQEDDERPKKKKKKHKKRPSSQPVSETSGETTEA